jgi:hypothetical protein
MARYVALSGGADSTALAILLHERGEDFALVFSDTGAELPETYFMVTKVAAQLGKELIVVSGPSFYEVLIRYGFMLPSSQRRWCTRELKQEPQHNYFQADDEVAIGIRADEPNRSTDPVRKRGAKTHLATYELVEAGMAKKDVLTLCKKHDLLNPIYRWRSSVSCFCCPLQRKMDWYGLMKNHPSFFALAEQWEEQSMKVSNGYTWCLNRQLSDMRYADAQQLKMWPEPDAEPCTICSI